MKHVLYFSFLGYMLFVFMAVSGCKCSSHCPIRDAKSDGRMRNDRCPMPSAIDDNCLLTQGVVKGNVLSCTIANTSTNDIVYLRPDSDFLYMLRYKNSNGDVLVHVSPVNVGFDGVKNIGVLSGQDPRYLSLNYNHVVQFDVKLPQDCVDIMEASVDFGYLRFDEFAGCRTLKAFVDAFYSRNRDCLRVVRLIKKNGS